MKGITRDVEKERGWRARIRAALRSGLSVREFCRQQRVKESQFYWWQHQLKERRQAQTWRREGRRKPSAGSPATFALVSDAPGALEAGIELVLADGRRVRIGQGVDEQTLRTVLAAVESGRC